MVVPASHLPKPVRFHRSNTTGSDYELVIGERYYPMHDVLGAEVIDVTPPVAAPQVNRKDLRSRVTRVIMLVAISLFVASFFVGWNSVAGRLMREIALFVSFGVSIDRFFRQKVVQPEYQLALRTRKESAEVITAADSTYLQRIADEINKRALRTSLPDGEKVISWRP